MKVTVSDIAKAAGVSLGTVSRVLNNHPSVNEEYRRRVQRAVKQMEYTPLRTRSKAAASASAHSLAGKNIAVVMLGMDRSLETLPVVATALHGAETAIAEADGNLLLADSPDLVRMPPWLGEDRVHGVILKGALQGDVISRTRNPLLDKLRNLPSVWLLGKPDGCWGDTTYADDLAVGQLAADHLVAHGHRHLAFVSPKPNHISFMRREAGFAMQAQQRDVQVTRFVSNEPEAWTVPLQPVEDVACVQDLVDQVLAQNPRPTAIFCPADSIAVLVYRALLAREVMVGKDISVISANHEVSLTKGLYPTLTTVDVHASAIGRCAVEQLMWRMAHRDHEPMQISVTPDLVEGASVVRLNTP